MDALIGFALWSLITWIVLGWNNLPSILRRGIPAGLVLGGLGCIGIAPFLEGRYSETVILFIGGPYPYRVETVERSFSLLLAGIGAALLALALLVLWSPRLPWNSPIGQASKLSVAILIFRVYFEKLGVPPEVAMHIGIIWLIVPLSVFFGSEAAKAASQRKFWSWLLGYAWGIRLLILLLMLLATHFHLGTHFDNSSVTRYTVLGEVEEVEKGSWDQYLNLIVFPQMVLWPAVTIAAGLLIGWPSYIIRSRRQGS